MEYFDFIRANLSQVLHAHKKPELEHLLQSHLLGSHNVALEIFQQNSQHEQHQ